MQSNTPTLEQQVNALKAANDRLQEEVDKARDSHLREQALAEILAEKQRENGTYWKLLGKAYEDAARLAELADKLHHDLLVRREAARRWYVDGGRFEILPEEVVLERRKDAAEDTERLVEAVAAARKVYANTSDGLGMMAIGHALEKLPRHLLDRVEKRARGEA